MFRLSEQVEWGLHCAVVLALLPDATAVSRAKLAELHGVPSAYLAKALQAMSRAGVVETVTGRNGGYRLAAPPAETSCLDIIDALEGEERFFHCTEIRRNLPATPGRRPPVCEIASVMHKAEDAWRAELARTSLADICDQVTTRLLSSAPTGVNPS